MTLSTSVIRPSILLLAEHPWFRRVATTTRPGRAVASRFVAGETLDQAMAVARDLDRIRVAAMLDHLGENVETAAQAVDARNAYLTAIGAIRLNPSIDFAVSLKLTQLGLDRSVEDCVGERRTHPRGGGRRRHAGDDRHGGPRLRRSDARGRAPGARRASAVGVCAPVLPAPVARSTSSNCPPASGCGW